jgi:hypothetical protein
MDRQHSLDFVSFTANRKIIAFLTAAIGPNKQNHRLHQVRDRRRYANYPLLHARHHSPQMRDRQICGENLFSIVASIARNCERLMKSAIPARFMKLYRISGGKFLTSFSSLD